MAEVRYASSSKAILFLDEEDILRIESSNNSNVILDSSIIRTPCDTLMYGRRAVGISTMPDESRETEISVYKNGTDSISITLNKKSTIDSVDSNWSHVEKMCDRGASYQLLRVNPKLTGNVKVVVDSNSNMFLDTFKVSNSMSQKRYRKIPINPSEYYGRHIMGMFGSMPTSDFYKVEDGCYSLFSPANNYDEQYYDKYNCGVRTNHDEMYAENFSILAPLHVGKIIPDFFLIFKIKNYRSIDNDSSMISHFMKNGELVKSFDMRENSNVGKYIRGIQNGVKDYIGDVYSSYDYDTYNIFNGISLDRGVVTDIYESVVNEREIGNQVALNDFYTLGFERNRIVSKDIINLEFMFDDKSEELFSINTYFGVYVKMHGESAEFSYISKSGDKFDASVSSFSPEGNEEVIYGFSTNDSFVRLKDSIHNSDDMLSEYYMKPGENILTAKIRKLGYDSGVHVMTLKFTESPDVGERFRISLNNKTEHKSANYDVIISNFKNKGERISKTDFYEYGQLNSNKTIECKSIYGCAHRDSIDKEDKSNVIREYVSLISEAFKEFNYKDASVDVSFDGIDSITIILQTDDRWDSVDFTKMFGKFMSKEPENVPSSLINDRALLFFGHSTASKTSIGRTESTGFNFNHLGYSIYGKTSFVKMTGNEYVVSNDVTGILTEGTVIYNSSSGYKILSRKFQGADVNISSIGGFGKNGEYVIKLENPSTYNDTIHFYRTYKINAGVCSIFQIKDFNFDVLDTKTISIGTAGEHIADGDFAGEYSGTNNSFGYRLCMNNEEKVENYFDKFEKYGLIENGSTSSYISKLLYGNGSSDISLTSPYCCKWGSVGTDARGESIRLMYNVKGSKSPEYQSISNNSDYSYFIPVGSIKNEVSGDIFDSSLYRYSRFDYSIGFLPVNNVNDEKYSYNKYIFDFHGKKVNGDNSSYSDNSYMNYVIDGNGSICDTIPGNSSSYRMSLAYTYGNDAIEFISAGIKFRIESTSRSIFNPQKYNGYNAIFIASPGNNPIADKRYGLIIDELTETIAIVMYTGMLSVDSSVFSGGKAFLQIPFSNDVDSIEVAYDGSLYIPYINKIPDASIINGTLYIDRIPYILDGYTDSSVLSIESSASDNMLYKNGYYVMHDASIYINGKDSSLTNKELRNNKILWDGKIGMYALLTPDDGYSVDGFTDKRTFNDITNDSLKSYSLTVKTKNGTKDYTNLYDIIKITKINPYLMKREDTSYNTVTIGYVHPTYNEPVMKDMLSFRYDEGDLSNSFKKCLNGCNIRVSNVEKINQIWIKKFFDTNSYSGKFSVGVSKLISPVVDCWSTGIFKKYSSSDEPSNVNGMKTGYEKNVFLASRGLNMNGICDSSGNVSNFIYITDWKNVEIDNYHKTIRFDITESIVNKIMFMHGYMSNWNEVDGVESGDRIRYIENSIIGYIRINNNTKFTFYKVPSETISFGTNSISDNNEMKNISNVLSYENGRYYMTLKNLSPGTYSAKAKIIL